MRSTVKVITITLAFGFLTVLAMAAGLMLAVWDTESSVAVVFGMDQATASGTEIGETQTITLTTGDIKEYVGKDVPGATIDRPITEGLSEGIKPADGVEPIDLKEFNENGGIHGNKDKSQGNSEDKSDEDIIDSDEEETPESKDKEREPLRITSEISGIAKIVRAGDEGDEVENSLPVPTQITEVRADYDPLEYYPQPFTEVDLSYFDDALFIGDSRVAGLAMNSGTNATFYAVTSFQLYRYKTFKVVQTANGKVPIFDVMPYDKFTKIYIKVGLNELGSVTDEPFLEAYTSLINDLRAMQPRAIIYIQAVLPVTQVKSQTDRVHCNENITKRNENLKSFAELMKCYYVDVGPYFADETGALKAETTADGIHMYSKYMPQWIDALRQNAVIWPPEQ